jgi:hypothetical protein
MTAGNAGTTGSGGTIKTGGTVAIAGGVGAAGGVAIGGAGGAGTILGGAGGAAATTGGAGGALNLGGGIGGAATTGGAGGALNLYSGGPGNGGSPAKGTISVKVGGASGTEVMTSTATGKIAFGRGLLAPPIYGATVTDYDAQAATLTIAGLLGGLVTQNSKNGASTATTPTGTEISAGITGVATGDSFWVMFYNRGDQTTTITAGASGVTAYGTVAVTTHKTVILFFYCSGANTWSCYTTVSG